MYGPDNFDFLFVLVSLGCILLGLGVMLFVTFLLSVARVLANVAPDHRRIEPGQVWLNLIPGFGVVWLPITVDRVAESLKYEFESRGVIERGQNYGRNVGLAALVLAVFGVIPYLGMLSLFAAFVCWVIYWIQLNGFSRRLRSSKYVPPMNEEW
jgi:hypothetical protein